MPSIHLRSLTFSYSVAVTVLDAVDLDLGPGWYGVVGPNGAGKTTLLDLIAGRLTPTSGDVHVVSDLPVGVCPQDVGDLDDRVCGFAWRWDGHAARLRSLLELDVADLDRWATLSPGERKRWQVGAALAAEPDVLLLDEPTNHLDRHARELLVDALHRFDGAGLVVSHDRGLLDALTATTLRVHGGRVEVWSGAYSTARERWRADEAARRERHERLRAEERRARRLLADSRRRLARSEQDAANRMRQAGHRDKDARSSVRKVEDARSQASVGAEIGARHARLDRARDALGAHEVRRSLGGNVAFEHARLGGRWLAEVDIDVLYAGDHPVLTDVHVALPRGGRVQVAGRNGVGKTTLVRAVLDVARVAGEVVAVLPQELTPHDVRDLLADTHALDGSLKGRILGILALLGVDPERVLATDDPSPGEARKLALAHAIGRPVTLVALDEPTNHLDLPSIERLEDALDGFPGSLLLVTHDDTLARRVTDTVWDLVDGRVTVRRR